MRAPLLPRPEPLADHHRIEGFDSGEAVLNSWLVRRARANQLNGASRTYVVARDGRVLGYYALATGGVDLAAVSSRFRRNMPDPIPAVILGRLAVARSEQGNGLGEALLHDALSRIVLASEAIGIALVLVNALNEKAKVFYERRGFRPSPLDPMVLVVSVKEVRSAMLLRPTD